MCELVLGHIAPCSKVRLDQMWSLQDVLVAQTTLSTLDQQDLHTHTHIHTNTQSRTTVCWYRYMLGWGLVCRIIHLMTIHTWPLIVQHVCPYFCDGCRVIMSSLKLFMYPPWWISGFWFQPMKMQYFSFCLLSRKINWLIKLNLVDLSQ